VSLGEGLGSGIVSRVGNVSLIAAMLDVVPSRAPASPLASSALDVLGLGEQPLSINAAMNHAACRLRIFGVFMTILLAPRIAGPA
jgi:hypothetical protein